MEDKEIINPEEVLADRPKPQKIKMRKAKVLRSISAPYLTNVNRGDVVSIPTELFKYYEQNGVIEAVKRKSIKSNKDGN